MQNNQENTSWFTLTQCLDCKNEERESAMERTGVGLLSYPPKIEFQCPYCRAKKYIAESNLKTDIPVSLLDGEEQRQEARRMARLVEKLQYLYETANQIHGEFFDEDEDDSELSFDVGELSNHINDVLWTAKDELAYARHRDLIPQSIADEAERLWGRSQRISKALIVVSRAEQEDDFGEVSQVAVDALKQMDALALSDAEQFQKEQIGARLKKEGE